MAKKITHINTFNLAHIHSMALEAAQAPTTPQLKKEEYSDKLSAIIKRLESVKNALFAKFGSKGLQLYEHTLQRLGAFDATTKNYNKNALLECGNLPYFVKHSDGSTEFGNLNFGESEFCKIDLENGIVEGYANTVIADSVGDVIFPEAYAETAAKMTTTYFMHHTDLPSGKILEQYIDGIGWYVKSQIDQKYRHLLKDGTLKGYSIGGRFRLPPENIGSAKVYARKSAVEISDLSHVTKPCNKLSFFAQTAGTKQKSAPDGVSKEICQLYTFMKSNRKDNFEAY